MGAHGDLHSPEQLLTEKFGVFTRSKMVSAVFQSPFLALQAPPIQLVSTSVRPGMQAAPRAGPRVLFFGLCRRICFGLRRCCRLHGGRRGCWRCWGRRRCWCCCGGRSGCCCCGGRRRSGVSSCEFSGKPRCICLCGGCRRRARCRGIDRSSNDGLDRCHSGCCKCRLRAVECEAQRFAICLREGVACRAFPSFRGKRLVQADSACRREAEPSARRAKSLIVAPLALVISLPEPGARKC